MRKMIAVWFVVVALALWGSVRLAQAREQQEEQVQQEEQEQTKAKPAKPITPENKPKTEQAEKPVHAYRLDFAINEIENGKKINTRHYSMNLNSGDRNELKIGTRVPVATGPSDVGTQFQYEDVGTRINCRLEEKAQDIALEVRSDFSNFSTPDEQRNSQSTSRFAPPIVRQMNINGSTLASSGHPVVIGSVDDPNSEREFQLEVTATRLK